MVDALNKLSQKGYKNGFKLRDKFLESLGSGKKYRPEDLCIVEYHRFEGETNPSDMSVVFALRSKNAEKGTVVSSYGTYANMSLISFLDKVKIQDRTAVAGK